MTMATAGGQQSVIEAYERLRQQAARMRELAQAGDWDALLDSQADYLRQVDRLRRLDVDVALDVDGMTRKGELLEAILDDDLQVRQQLMARRDELGELLTASRRQRQMHRAYGRQAASALEHGGVDPSDPAGKREP